jgi:hypothetical protein
MIRNNRLNGRLPQTAGFGRTPRHLQRAQDTVNGFRSEVEKATLEADETSA